MPTDRGNAFAGNYAGRNVWQNTICHKTLSRKRKKLALLSKPHILQSQMVLLSEHLVLDLDWVEFQENPRFKKKWLIWGKQTSAASFQALICGSCGLLHMEIFLFSSLAYFQQTTWALLLIGRNWEEGRGSFTHGALKLFKNRGHHWSWTAIWVHLNMAVSQS